MKTSGLAEWKKSNLESEDDVPVWLDIEKVDLAWRKYNLNSYVTNGGGGDGVKKKYDGVGIWLQTNDLIWRPFMSLDREAILFTDGRHRVAWLRAHGAKVFQTGMHRDSVSEALRMYGSNHELVTRWQLPP